MPDHKLCFASNNPKKLEEIRKALPASFQLLSLKEIGCEEELPETTGTIPGNSRQKAQYVWENHQINCFADDTGLEVTTLNGAPGVDSAFYAGPQRSAEDNMDLLLKNLENKPNRLAQFRTIITLFFEGQEFQFEGIVKGTILKERQGEKGFGYDPIFQPEGYDGSFAEMGLAQKNQISHRGRAMKKLMAFLQEKM